MHLAGVPYKEIFEDQGPFAARKWCAARAARNLTVNSLWPSLGFDDLINRAALRAFEWDGPDHGYVLLTCEVCPQGSAPYVTVV